MNPQSDILDALEQASTAIAAFTGLRSIAIEQGWPEEQAGELVLLLLKGGQNGSNA